MSSQLLTFDENYNNEFVAVSGETEILEQLNDEFEEFEGKRKNGLYIFPKKNSKMIKMFVDGINSKIISSGEEEKEGEEEDSEEESEEEEEESEGEEEESEEESEEEEEHKTKDDIGETEEKEVEKLLEKVIKLIKVGKVVLDLDNDTELSIFEKLSEHNSNVTLEFVNLIMKTDTPYNKKFLNAVSHAKIKREQNSASALQLSVEQRKRMSDAVNRLNFVSRMIDVENRMKMQGMVLQKEAEEYFKYKREEKRKTRDQYINDMRPVEELSSSDKIKNIKYKQQFNKPLSDDEKKALEEHEEREKVYSEELQKLYYYMTLAEVQKEVRQIEILIKFEKPITPNELKFYKDFKKKQKLAEYNVNKKFGLSQADVPEEKDLSYYTEEIERGKKHDIKVKFTNDEIENYKKLSYYVSNSFLCSYLSCDLGTLKLLLENAEFTSLLKKSLQNPKIYGDLIKTLQETREFATMLENADNKYQYYKSRALVKKEYVEKLKELEKDFKDLLYHELAFIAGIPVSIVRDNYEQNKVQFDKVKEEHVKKNYNNFMIVLKQLRQQLCKNEQVEYIEVSRTVKLERQISNIIYSQWYRFLKSQNRINVYDYEFLCTYQNLIEIADRKLQVLLQAKREEKEEEKKESKEEEEKEEESKEEEEKEEVDFEEFVEESLQDKMYRLYEQIREKMRKQEEKRRKQKKSLPDFEVKLGKLKLLTKVLQEDGEYTDVIETVDGPIFVLKEYVTRYMTGIPSEQKIKQKRISELMIPSMVGRKELTNMRNQKLDTLKRQIDFFKWFLEYAESVPTDADVNAKLKSLKLSKSNFFQFFLLDDENKKFVARSLVSQYEAEEQKSTITYKSLNEILSEEELEIYNKDIEQITAAEFDMRREISEKVDRDRESVQNFLRIDVSKSIRDTYNRVKPKRRAAISSGKDIYGEEEDSVYETIEDEAEIDEIVENDEEEKDLDMYSDAEEREKKKKVEDKSLEKQLFGEFVDLYLTKKKNSDVTYEEVLKKFNDWMLRAYPTQPSVTLSITVMMDRLGELEQKSKRIGNKEVKTMVFENWKFQENKERKEAFESFQEFAANAKVYDEKNIKYINFNKNGISLTDEEELDKLYKRFNETTPLISEEFYKGYKNIWLKYNNDRDENIINKKIALMRYTQLYLINKTKMLRNPLIINPIKRNRRLRLLRESKEHKYFSRLPKNISESTRECMVWSVSKPWIEKSFDYILIGDAFGHKSNQLYEGKNIFGQFDSTIEQNGKTIYLYRPTKYYHYLVCSLNTADIYPQCSTEKDYLTLRIENLDVGIYTVLVSFVPELMEKNGQKILEKKKKYYVLSKEDYETECAWWKTKQNQQSVIIQNIENQQINEKSPFFIELKKYCHKLISKSVYDFYQNFVKNKMLDPQSQNNEQMEKIMLMKERYFKHFADLIIDIMFNSGNRITYQTLIRKFVVFCIPFTDLLRGVSKHYKKLVSIDPVRINRQYFINIFNIRIEDVLPEVYLHPDSMTRTLLINFFTRILHKEVEKIIVDVYNKVYPNRPMLIAETKDINALEVLKKQATDVIVNCKSLTSSFSKDHNKFVWKNLKTNMIYFVEIPPERFFITLADFISFLNANFARYNLNFKETDGKITITNNSFEPIRLISDREANELKSAKYEIKSEVFTEPSPVILDEEPSLCLACGLVHPFAKKDAKLGDTSGYENCNKALITALDSIPVGDKKEYTQKIKTLISKHALQSSKSSKSLQEFEKRKDVAQNTYIVSIYDSAMDIFGFTGNYKDTVISPSESKTAEQVPALFQKDNLLTKYIANVPSEQLISIQTLEGDIICIDMLELYRAKLERVITKEPFTNDYIIHVEYLPNPVTVPASTVDVISEVIQSTIYPKRPFIFDQQKPFTEICRYCSTELENDNKTIQTFEQILKEGNVQTNFAEFCSSTCFDKYKEKGEREFELVSSDFAKLYDTPFDKSRLNYRLLNNFLTKILSTEDLFISPVDMNEYVEKYYPDKENFSMQNLMQNIKMYKIKIEPLLPYISQTFILSNKKVIEHLIDVFDMKDVKKTNEGIITFFFRILMSFDPLYADVLTPNVSIPEEVLPELKTQEQDQVLKQISENAIIQELKEEEKKETEEKKEDEKELKEEEEKEDKIINNLADFIEREMSNTGTYINPRQQTEFTFDDNREQYIRQLIAMHFDFQKKDVDKIHENTIIDINNIYNSSSLAFALEEFVLELMYINLLTQRQLSVPRFAKDFLQKFCNMVQTIYIDNIIQNRLKLDADELDNFFQYILYTQRSNSQDQFETYKKMIETILTLNFQLEDAVQKRQYNLIADYLDKFEELSKQISENYEIQNIREDYSNKQIQTLKDSLYKNFSSILSDQCNIIIEIIRNQIIIEDAKPDYTFLSNKEFMTDFLGMDEKKINTLKTLSNLSPVFVAPALVAYKHYIYNTKNNEDVAFIKNLLNKIIENFQNNQKMDDLKTETIEYQPLANFDVYFYQKILGDDIYLRQSKFKMLKNLIRKEFNIDVPHIVSKLAKFLNTRYNYLSENNFLATYLEFIKIAEPFILSEEQINHPELTEPLFKKFREMSIPFLIDNIYLNLLKIDKETLNQIFCEYEDMKKKGTLNEETKKPFDHFFVDTLNFYKKNASVRDEKQKEELLKEWSEQQEIAIDLGEKCSETLIGDEELYNVKRSFYIRLISYLTIPADVQIIFDGDFLALKIKEKDEKANIIINSKPSDVFHFDDSTNVVIDKNNPYFITQLNPPTASQFFEKGLDAFNITLQNNFPETCYIGAKGYTAPELPDNVRATTLNYNLDYANHWGQRKLLLTEIDFLNQVMSDRNEKIDIIYAGAAHGTHIPILFGFFPNIRLHLYDPAVFDMKLEPLVKAGKITINEFYFEKKYKDLNIHKNTPFLKYNQRQKLPEDYGFFTSEVAEYYKQKFYKSIKNYSNCLFISDIRRDLPKENYKVKGKSDWSWDFEKIVLEDQEFMKNWLQIMIPKHSMLKYKEPYVKEGRESLYKYFKGTIRLQTWHPPNSAETRLLVSHEDINNFVFYDIIAYERKTSYYNYLRTINLNDMKIPFFSNEKQVKLSDIGKAVAPNLKYYTIDLYNEVVILKDYYDKFSKDELSFDECIKWMRYITAIIDRSKRNNPNAFVLKMKEQDDF